MPSIQTRVSIKTPGVVTQVDQWLYPEKLNTKSRNFLVRAFTSGQCRGSGALARLVRTLALAFETPSPCRIHRYASFSEDRESYVVLVPFREDDVTPAARAYLHALEFACVAVNTHNSRRQPPYSWDTQLSGQTTIVFWAPSGFDVSPLLGAFADMTTEMPEYAEGRDRVLESLAAGAPIQLYQNAIR